MLTFPEIERALVVMAHPDDVDFGAAGTVAVLTDAGVHVTYCLVTDGDAGGSDRSIPRHDMAMLRRREQTEAAAKVGVTDLVFLGHGDGRVQPTLQLRADISAVIRRVRPRIVISQSPERNLDRIYASHPDHLAAAEATLCAVYPDARNPFAFPELFDEDLEPWAVDEVWVAGGLSGPQSVDVTAAVDRKIAALMCHVSQHTDPQRTATMVREWMTNVAKQLGLPDGAAAETFRVVDTR
ncbi:MAG TPA: PIG-L deacetylase family protein [Ilumatobacteraceae bacterium]|nr:PIG-L deacetylase family protein [Ilumatobacteraceae bacterium]